MDVDYVRVRMKPTLIAQLDKYADTKALSRSDVIRLAAIEFLKRSRNDDRDRNR